ncbi:unnamed protein product [Notodromas monacha]|uniref:Amine oxidase domain-containing protein n=1 Tax=Notodromas monacha TaxID=399045 RepID=A0A7R9GE77_9CRUS|nr:unnamed protein product [Notodromas monacha]CAG0917975.1 unnamed protein product [Notodromas monacha]
MVLENWACLAGLTVLAYLVYWVLKPVLKAVYLAISCPLFSATALNGEEGPYPTEKEKDEVLNKSFKPERVPQNLDAIVIGSGPSGLTAAHFLARAGKKVLVLEQHDTVGGTLHTFVEHGYEFDTGLHISFEVGEEHYFGVIMKQLTGGKVKFLSTNGFKDEIVIGSHKYPKKGVRKYFFPPESVDEWQQRMLKYFPGEDKLMKSLSKDVKWSLIAFMPFVLVKLLPEWLAMLLIKLKVFDIFTSYPKQNSISTEEKFQEVAERHPDMPLLLNPFNLDLNVSCDDFPYAVWAVTQKAYLDGVDVTFNQLLPRSIRDSSRWYKNAKPFLNEPSGYFQLFVGLNREAHELNLPWQTIRTFSSDKPVGEVYKEYLSLPLEEALEVDIPFLAIFFSSAKDPTYNDRHPGKATVEIFGVANNDWFKQWQNLPLKKRGDEYDGLKKAFGQKILDKTLELYPELKDHVDCVIYGTSAAIANYLGRNSGGGAKLDNTRARLSLEASTKMRTDTGIPGLYLTGEDTLINSVEKSRKCLRTVL